MPDPATQVLVKSTKLAIKASAKASVGASLRSAIDDPSGRITKVAETIVGAAIDGMTDQIMRGSVTTSTLTTTVIKAGAALGGLSESERMLCVSALLDLAADGISASALISSSAAVEVGTAGLATPLVAAQAVLLANSALGFANATIKANQQCGPLVVRGYETVKTDWANLTLQWSNAIADLEQELEWRMMNSTFP